jgi:hypothetical protein
MLWAVTMAEDVVVKMICDLVLFLAVPVIGTTSVVHRLGARVLRATDIYHVYANQSIFAWLRDFTGPSIPPFAVSKMLASICMFHSAVSVDVDAEEFSWSIVNEPIWNGRQRFGFGKCRTATAERGCRKCNN